MPLSPLKELAFGVISTVHKTDDGVFSDGDAETALRLTLGPVGAKLVPLEELEIHKPASRDQYAKFRGAPWLFFRISAKPVLDTHVFDVSVSIEIDDVIPNPRTKAYPVTAVLWKEVAGYYAGSNKLDEVIRKGIKEVTDNLALDWMEAHAADFPKEPLTGAN